MAIVEKKERLKTTNDLKSEDPLEIDGYKGNFAKSVTKMEPIPLVPKSTIKSNHDTAHVLRASFQELLAKAHYPGNIMKNMSKFSVEMEELKNNALFAQYSQSKYKHNTALIAEAEKEMMEHHGIYLIGKEVLGKDKMLTECLQLKTYSLLPDVRTQYANKFGLIKQDALLPSIPERAIDFKLNSNRHHCMRKCLSNTSMYVSDFVPSEKQIEKGRPKKTLESIFEATPRQIVIRNYKLNVTYKKVLKIRNVTNMTRSIALKEFPKTKYFVLTLESSCRIAPGMCAVYSIKYNTDIYRDVKETVRFTTYTGQDVVVKLQSCSFSPNLKVYVFRTGLVTPDKLNDDALSQSEFNIRRTAALNSSIDCGYTLIGREVKLSLIMKNEGGYGRFFFMNEADWYHYSILNINTSMELLAGSFRLYPVYFEINENEFVEVMISFYPKHYGLFVETVCLLCSNNTCEELDFIGDGVYFEKSFITFELKPKDCHPFFLDYESQYCVHLGKTLCCQPTTGIIKIQNQSPLNLEYRWRVRRSENSTNPDFKHLASHWVTIEDNTRILPYYNTKNLLVYINPETTVEGLYRIVLCLYIENIPEISLSSHEDFTVIERADSTPELKLVDVLVAEIELLVDVEAIGVLIEPNPLIIPYRPHTNVKYTEKITVIPQTNYNLGCQWKHHKSNCGTTIEPRIFPLDNKNVQCTVTVGKTVLGNMEEKFLLWVNNGAFKQHFQVILTTELPRVVFNPAAIIFDDLMNEFLYEQTVYIENCSTERVNWHIIEEVLDSEKNTTGVDMVGSRIVPNSGILKAGDKCLIKYTANTDILGENHSFLKIFTNFTDTDKFDSICSVRYSVCKPELLVHTNTSELPILCPEELLFVGIEMKMHICIHNTGNIVAIFLWGEPTGPAATDFNILISPRIGIIKVGETIHVDVVIKPKAMGYFEDVFIPLFALGIDKIILVKLMCLVGDITVNIYIPDIDDEYCPILWPKIIPDEYEEKIAPEFSPIIVGSAGEEGSSHLESFENTSAYFENTSYIGTDEDEMKILYRPDFSITCEAETSSAFGKGQTGKSSWSSDLSSSKISSSRNLSSEVGSLTSTPKRSIKEIFNQLFKEDITLQKYCIEFQKVPLRTPVMKTIKIENITPGEGLVYVEVVNFYQEAERKNMLNDVLAKLKIAKSTEWEDIITPEGIVLKVEEPSRTLHSFEIIEFNIWVYATTWGYYLDEVVIDISQMLPFCASILIEVIGHPIEYPIAQNSIERVPTVRMGVLPYKSENVQRRIKVVNKSVCTVFISWQIFLNVEEEPTKSFSVLLDLPLSEVDFEECESKARFVLTNEYYGQVNANYFEIQPMVSKIPPGEHTYVSVTTNVSNFDECFLNQAIFSHLVGVIKVPCACRKKPNLFARPHGIDIGCTKVKITFQIDLPTLLIDDLPDKILLTTCAADILEKEVFQTTRRLLLKNATHTDALVFVDIEKPFKIVNVVIPHMRFKELQGSVIMNPEDTMEVIIECSLSKEDILEIVENLKMGTKPASAISMIDFVQNSLKISKHLSIYQRDFLQKTIPLELKIFFPVFKANPIHIQFGNVFIGNTAKQIVSLRNMTASPLRFTVYKMDKYPEIIITPNDGVIPKFTSGSECVLSLFFTPTEPQTYLLWFAVETMLPHHFVVINVVGVGTYDENFYRPGLH